MKAVHDFPQGSDQWLAFRRTKFGASEAAAMLGLSSKVKRNELLAMKATGSSREFSDWFQEHVLDIGHEVEALARPIVEKQIGEDLYQMTFSDGNLSCSVDGITVDDSLAWEHKQWNLILASSIASNIVPDEYMPQCQQVLMVTGAKELIFTVSNGTADHMASAHVMPDQEWFARIRAGWEQFAEDLHNYIPPTTKEPEPVADTIDALPSLLVNVEGRVLSSNLEAYRAGAERFLSKINTTLVTDLDFINAEKAVKFCKAGEDRLALVKAQALEQTVSIAELFSTVDAISERMRSVRLQLDKLTTQRKTERRAEIAAGGHRALRDHVLALNERLGNNWVPAPSAGPFVDALKGLKTLDSLQNAVDTALANAKIAANELADRLERNRKSLIGLTGTDWFFLFADFATVGAKLAEDFSAIAALRIQAHQAELARVAEVKKAREDAAVAAPVVAPPVAAAAPLAQPAPAPIAAPAAAPKQARPPISTGTLCDLLGGVYTAEYFTKLGFKAVAPPDGKKTGVWWARADVAMICREMIARLQGVIDGEG